MSGFFLEERAGGVFVREDRIGEADSIALNRENPPAVVSLSAVAEPIRHRGCSASG
jgi:hypothetical protein